MQNDRVAYRLVFLAFAGVALLTGLAAGASLLGVLSVAAPVADLHGPLMVFGFVGGAIGLERAVAVRRAWAWAGPAAHVAGVVALLVPPAAGADLPALVPGALFAASFGVLGAIYVAIYRRQQTVSVVVQAAGVVAAVMAALLWGMTGRFETVLPLAVAYVVATIIGERMELARLSVAGTRAEVQLTWQVLAMVLAAVVHAVAPRLGHVLVALALIVVAATALRVDVAVNLVRSRDLPRYSAACMLGGYFWLVLAGFTWLAYGPGAEGYAYDAVVHAVFLGFVMSMIFAHAPIILTAVVHRRLPYRRVLYVPVVLLHGGLATRLAGDFLAQDAIYTAGGVITLVAVLVFVGTGLVLTLRGGGRAD